jgi:hypothetical protein
MEHPLQKPYSILLRYVLSQSASTAHWTASLLTGHMPVQHMIIQEFCRLWNRLLSSDNDLVLECLIQQQALLVRGKRCWLRSWHNAFLKLAPELGVHDNLAQMGPLEVRTIMHGFTNRYTDLLDAMGNPLLPICPHRKIAFTWHLTIPQHKWGQPARHLLNIALPPAVRRSWLQLLTANAPVPAFELVADIPYQHRYCVKCTSGAVGNIHHVLFHCSATTHIRMQFHNNITWHDNLSDFLYLNSTDTCPFFVHQALAAYNRARTRTWQELSAEVLAWRF